MDISLHYSLFLARAVSAGAITSAAADPERTVSLGLLEGLGPLTGVYDINRLDLELSAGGYDAVAQVAAAECARRLARVFRPNVRRGLTAPELESILAEGRPFGNPALNDAGLTTRLGENAFLEVELRVERLRIEAGGTLTIALRGRASLVQLAVSPSGVADAGEIIAFPVATLGDYEATLDGRWVTRPESDNVRVTIYLDAGALALRGSRAAGDFHAFYRSVLAADEHALLIAPLRTLRNVPLSPTLSILGRAPAHLSAGGLVAQLDVTVVQSGDQQAFAVGWNLGPGRPASLEAIRHAIGPHGYGVLHSGASIRAVTAHHWTRPEFDRSFSVEVQEERTGRDGRRERFVTPVQVTLDTLATAGCAEEAAARGACLRFTGNGVLRASSTRRADGTVVDIPAQRRAFRYDVAGRLVSEPTWSSDPVLLGVQRILHRAFETLMRPFERWTTAAAPRLEEFRLDGIRNRAIFVGELSD